MNQGLTAASHGTLLTHIKASVFQGSLLTQRKLDHAVYEWLQANPWPVGQNSMQEFAIVYLPAQHFETYTLLVMELRIRRTVDIEELDEFSDYVLTLLHHLCATDDKVAFAAEGAFRWRITAQS